VAPAALCTGGTRLFAEREKKSIKGQFGLVRRPRGTFRRGEERPAAGRRLGSFCSRKTRSGQGQGALAYGKKGLVARQRPLCSAGPARGLTGAGFLFGHLARAYGFQIGLRREGRGTRGGLISGLM